MASYTCDESYYSLQSDFSYTLMKVWFCLKSFGFGKIYFFLRQAITQASLETSALLPPTPVSWGYSHTLPRLALSNFFAGLKLLINHEHNSIKKKIISEDYVWCRQKPFISLNLFFFLLLKIYFSSHNIF